MALPHSQGGSHLFLTQVESFSGGTQLGSDIIHKYIKINNKYNNIYQDV
jgi:hypothetical protein